MKYSSVRVDSRVGLSVVALVALVVGYYLRSRLDANRCLDAAGLPSEQLAYACITRPEVMRREDVVERLIGIAVAQEGSAPEMAMRALAMTCGSHMDLVRRGLLLLAESARTDARLEAMQALSVIDLDPAIVESIAALLVREVDWTAPFSETCLRALIRSDSGGVRRAVTLASAGASAEKTNTIRRVLREYLTVGSTRKTLEEIGTSGSTNERAFVASVLSPR